MNPLKVESSKERYLDAPLSLDSACQGVLSKLRYNCIPEVG